MNSNIFNRIKGKITLASLKCRWATFGKTPQSINKFCAILSLYTVVAFNIPAFALVLDNIERSWNGLLIFLSVGVLMFVLNYLFYYLLLWLGRIVGKIIIAFTLMLNAGCLYAINAFEAYITEPTIANVFNTRYSEASGFFSFSTIVYLFLLGIPVCVYLFSKKIKYSTPVRFAMNILVSLLLVALLLFANMRNILWIDRNATLLGGRLLPWSYVVNTARHIAIKIESNKKAIILPDARITTDSKDVCVLIIGESARRENFSLYGYHRNTNPLLAGDSVRVYVANSADVSTIGGVKAILSHKSSDDLYEILPNYLHRHGVDVVWRTNNWGEPPLSVDKYINLNGLAETYPGLDRRYDGLLFAGLADEINGCTKDKQLIVIHCYTSHGPEYYSNYPAEFNVFTPVCKDVDMSQADRQGLVNAYDNTILYTDYLVHSVIETLRQVEGKRCCMMFVSDHGESLGENGMFMHGTLPLDYAPRQQYEIPFIVWENDSVTRTKDLKCVQQYYVFHSVLNWFGVESSIYNEKMNVFEPVK